MNSIEKQTITMAAICQASALVQKVARTGSIAEPDLAIMLNSIMKTSPDSILDVYGNDVAHLTLGLKTLVEQLGSQTKQKDPELTRYVVSLLGLERRLANKKNQFSLLGERIEQSQRQLAHYDITSDTLIASLASIYSDLLALSVRLYKWQVSLAYLSSRVINIKFAPYYLLVFALAYYGVKLAESVEIFYLVAQKWSRVPNNYLKKYKTNFRKLLWNFQH